MAKKRNTEQIAIVVAVIAVIMMFASGGITGASVKGVSIMPDKQCYNLAKNKDKTAENVATKFSFTGERKSPCNMSGERLSYDSYIDPHMGGFSRRVFENGDAEGHIMNTDYILCKDGRAKVEILSTYYIRGIAWGLWYNHPLISYPDYTIEKCSTI